jgi:phenylalanyl-tRNA synthetase beta chain
MEESAKILEGYGIRRTENFESEIFGEHVRAFMPPTWRPDIAIEEDLIEEIGRWRGYDASPAHLPGLLPRRGDVGPETSLAGALRACALARGYVEAITYSFLPESFVSALHLPENDLRAHPLLLANPISQDWVAMRTTLLPGLLNGLKESVASGWRGPVRVFEIGRIFLRSALQSVEHRELDVLAGLVYGGTDPRTPWPETRDDFLSVKADVLALLEIRGHKTAFVQGSEPFAHAGQTASIPDVGYLARLSPTIERELDFAGPVYIFELNLAALENAEKPVYTPASPFPASFRDISMLVSNDRTQDEVLAEIRASIGTDKESSAGILESVKLFDIYSGKGIPDGFRSMAFSLCYHAPDRTLNDEEVDKIHNSVRDALSKKGYNMR